MARTSVFEPLFDEGLPSINFFNGRLLSAEDLKTERKANREGHRRLGTSIGDGVVHGLVVRRSSSSTAAEPSVTVDAGLAINRSGDTIRLQQKTEVLLREPEEPGGTQVVKIFRDCVPPRGGAYVAGSGAYVLAVTKLQRGVGLAPVSGLGNESADCITKYLIEGVEFELHEIALGAAASDPARLRNHLAYGCFGAVSLTDAGAAPLADGPGDYGTLGALRIAGTLSPCAVPLAIVHWTTSGIQFVDGWAARRRPVPAAEPPIAWQVPLVPRRAAEAEAMLFQFQDHLDALRQELPNPRTAAVTSHFRYLPPAGLVPLASASYAAGFEYPRFFQDCYRREPVFIDAARVEPLLRASWNYPPIDLQEQQMIWLYRVRENVQRMQAAPPPQECLLFASGDMPFVGQARFDVSRWDFSNYSLVEGALD